MAASVWAYSDLRRTSLKECQEQGILDPRKNIFDIVMIESGYKDADDIYPGIMEPMKLGEIYSTTPQSTIYSASIKSYKELLSFLLAIEEYMTLIDKCSFDYDEERMPFAEIMDVVETDALFGCIVCEKLHEDFIQYHDEFFEWLKTRTYTTKAIREIYKAFTEAFNIGRYSGCVIAG